MVGGSQLLVHELWEESDGPTMVCQAGPAGDAAPASLGRRARLQWVFEARSHFDAMTQYHARMNWAPYTSSQLEDLDPYPAEWIARQQAALVAELGDRAVIASGRMASAWREAAADLGIRFESPFAMQYGGADYWCSGWLPDFGGPTGAIIACRHSVDAVLDVADSLNFYASGLSPYYYEVYDRDSFVETLNDWGWFGDPLAVPPWFSGALGRHGGND